MAPRNTPAIGIMIIALNASARSQDLDFGKTEFLSKCAECHGADGKGNGPHSAKMKPKPTDLTIIAKRNNGAFSPDAVYGLIDGRAARTSHGSPEMPIWECRHLSSPVLRPNIYRWFFQTIMHGPERSRSRRLTHLNPSWTSLAIPNLSSKSAYRQSSNICAKSRKSDNGKSLEKRRAKGSASASHAAVREAVPGCTRTLRRKVRFALATRAPSIHGPFRHLARCSAMSEVEVIAEVTGARSKCSR